MANVHLLTHPVGADGCTQLFHHPLHLHTHCLELKSCGQGHGLLTARTHEVAFDDRPFMSPTPHSCGLDSLRADPKRNRAYAASACLQGGRKHKDIWASLCDVVPP